LRLLFLLGFNQADQAVAALIDERGVFGAKILSTTSMVFGKFALIAAK
jgi:hypothetical protein